MVTASTETGLEGTNLTEICAMLSAAQSILTDIIVNFELIPFSAGQCYTRVSMVDFIILVPFYDYVIITSYVPLIVLSQTPVTMQLWVVYRL